MALPIIDYGESHCRPCGAWCCKGEAPFVGSEEAQALGVTAIESQPSGECRFLSGGRCTVYAVRPFECRIFPFDIVGIQGVPTWVLWETCPAHSILDPESHVEHYETTLAAGLPPGYIESYVAYHHANLPAKYHTCTYKVLRPVKTVGS